MGLKGALIPVIVNIDCDEVVRVTLSRLGLMLVQVHEGQDRLDGMVN